MGRPYSCPWCGATVSVSKGVRKTKTMGDRSIRLCKSCGRKFTPKNQRPVEGAESMAAGAMGSEEAKPSEAIGVPRPSPA
jgi:transcription elongation factor Elf1